MVQDDESQERLAKWEAERRQELLPLESKLRELRLRLVEDLSIEELQALQVQTDLLEDALAADNFHHHDTNEHHDHEFVVDRVAFDPGGPPRPA